MACLTEYVLVACGNASATAPSGDASTPTTNPGASCDAALAATPAPVGAPCVFDQERSPTFAGASVVEISTEVGGSRCSGRVCISDRFQGRVTCPYGEDANGNGPDGGPGCFTPGTCVPVRPNDPVTGQTVPAQCTNRTAATAVYCSCRCASPDGGADDAGQNCACPSGMTCELPGFPVGVGYCFKIRDAGTLSNTCAATCNPTTAPCQ